MSLMHFIRAKVIRRFINIRLLLQKNLPYDEIIRVELLVAMCLIAFSCGMTYIIVGLFVGLSFFSIVNYLLFFITTIPLVLYLINKGYHNYAKLIMMVLGDIFMFIKASSLGPDSGMNLSMLIILFATFAFYRIDDYKFILLSLFLLFGCIIFLEITNYSFLPRDVSTNQYEYEFNLASTIVFCILFFYVILRVNQYTNIKLKKLNLRLKNKNKKLGKINEELDSYVYKASHDLRAPLTSLMGIISLIKTEKNTEQTTKLIEMQEHCVSKLDAHIHQIIHLSKNIKTGFLVEKIDIKEMIDSVLDELSYYENASVTQKITTLRQDVDFYSDGYRLRTILHNLISNAFKYARSNEPFPRIEVKTEISLAMASITIRDNGIGISQEQQTKIFDMFYRGTTMSTGSGLGLYMVKEMVLKLNGTILVDSKVGEYTSITFIIPNQYATMFPENLQPS